MTVRYAQKAYLFASYECYTEDRKTEDTADAYKRT